MPMASVHIAGYFTGSELAPTWTAYFYTILSKTDLHLFLISMLSAASDGLSKFQSQEDPMSYLDTTIKSRYTSQLSVQPSKF